ncbi:MAG: hypothetical protein IIB77_08395 [Proteobacteria bacterium]|nr:hypothetical protein [Pseudomonadota bacterium]
MGIQHSWLQPRRSAATSSSQETNLGVVLLSIASLIINSAAFGAEVRLPIDTRVYVETMETLVAKGGRVRQGDLVRSKVWRDVVVGNKVVIAAGTPVIARVDSVKGRSIAGIKGKMTIGAYETESVDGQSIQLSGGYGKEGKGRMALSIVGAVLFIPLIFIPGSAAEMPAGSVFDSYVGRSFQIEVEDAPKNRVIDLTSFSSDEITAELLYEKLAQQEKPKNFEFLITVPEEAPRAFVIDRINGERIKPIKLKHQSEVIEDEEAMINVTVKIKTLIKKFRKGINTIEIAYGEGEERISTEIVVNLQI